MPTSPESFEDDSDVARQPSWLGIRVGIPIAVILIGLASAKLWDLQFRVLASGDVTLGRQNYRLQLKEDRGWLNGCARSSQGEVCIQRLVALATQPARGQPQAPLTRREVQNARLVVDARRQEAWFVLDRATITFDGHRFSLKRNAPQAEQD